MSNEFSTRLKLFRKKEGLSQKDLADELGVGKITVLRWENGTSKPSILSAEKLTQIGFGKINREDTNHDSIPRLTLNDSDELNLRDAISKTIKINNKNLNFEPSPYVINGPENQVEFFKKLFAIQEKSTLSTSKNDYLRRLSSIAFVDNKSTAQYDLENPKPTAKHWNPNYGPHGWHRYVGRFPPHLVRALINSYASKKGSVICDPFAGSGTTLVESRLLGMRAIGIEVCPLSALISRTKSQFPSDTIELELIFDELFEFYTDKWNSFVGNRSIKDISHEEIVSRQGNDVPVFPNYKKWFNPEALLGTSIVVEYAKNKDGYLQDFICCALSSSMRSIGNLDVDVVRAEYRKTPRIDVDVIKLVLRVLRKMVLGIKNSTKSHEGILSSAKDVKVIESSILETKIDMGSVDHIITSPPYGVEATSYLRTHLLSYRAIQSILDYDPYYFNEKIIGSEYVLENDVSSNFDHIFDESKTLEKFYSSSLPKDLTKKLIVRKNMMLKFFSDMFDVAMKFKYWIKKGGKVAFVIGNKKIGDFIIPTDQIIIELFKVNGFILENSINHKLKCNNSNSQVPWQEKIIQEEYILQFKKG
ncbi:DNA methyltransferase [Thermodesulfobacteriota bacterium]